MLNMDSVQTTMFRGALHSPNNESLMSGSVRPSSGDGEKHHSNMIPMTLHLPPHEYCSIARFLLQSFSEDYFSGVCLYWISDVFLELAYRDVHIISFNRLTYLMQQ